MEREQVYRVPFQIKPSSFIQIYKRKINLEVAQIKKKSTFSECYLKLVNWIIHYACCKKKKNVRQCCCLHQIRWRSDHSYFQVSFIFYSDDISTVSQYTRA